MLPPAPTTRRAVARPSRRLGLGSERFAKRSAQMKPRSSRLAGSAATQKPQRTRACRGSICREKTLMWRRQPTSSSRDHCCCWSLLMRPASSVRAYFDARSGSETCPRGARRITTPCALLFRDGQKCEAKLSAKCDEAFDLSLVHSLSLSRKKKTNLFFVSLAFFSRSRRVLCV